MALKLNTSPTVEPLGISDVEAQVRADLSTEAALVGGYIVAVRQKAELALRRALVTQVWDLALDGFPCMSMSNRFAAIEIPLPPLQSVESVKYLDSERVLTEMASEDYVVDLFSTPARVMPGLGKNWPKTADFPSSVQISFTAGYGDAAEDVPQCIRNWMLLNVANLYEHRETLSAGSGGVIEMHTLADSLLDPERWEVRV